MPVNIDRFLKAQIYKDEDKQEKTVYLNRDFLVWVINMTPGCINHIYHIHQENRGSDKVKKIPPVLSGGIKIVGVTGKSFGFLWNWISDDLVF